jgi:hypothetical protein
VVVESGKKHKKSKSTEMLGFSQQREHGVSYMTRRGEKAQALQNGRRPDQSKKEPENLYEGAKGSFEEVARGQ